MARKVRISGCSNLVGRSSTQWPNIGTVAIHTFCGSWLVEGHVFVTNWLREFVTLVTWHVGMAAFQREMRTCVVIERRWHPALNIVAIGAGCLSFLHKLPAVGIDVARFALLRRTLELNFPRIRLHFVALTATNGAVRPEQRKLGLGMIETVYVGP